MSETRTVFVVIGFDADGNAVEVSKAESAQSAESAIAGYPGSLVNLHYVMRQEPVDNVGTGLQKDEPAVKVSDDPSTSPTDLDIQVDEWPSADTVDGDKKN